MEQEKSGESLDQHISTGTRAPPVVVGSGHGGGPRAHRDIDLEWIPRAYAPPQVLLGESIPQQSQGSGTLFNQTQNRPDRKMNHHSREGIPSPWVFDPSGNRCHSKVRTAVLFNQGPNRADRR